VLENLARHPNPHVLQFHGAWEEKEQLHIRTTLAECGDLASYLTSISETGGLDEARCWKLLFELTLVSFAYARDGQLDLRPTRRHNDRVYDTSIRWGSCIWI